MADRRQSRNRRRAPSQSHATSLTPARDPNGTRTAEDIHVCPECGSEMVQPQEWAPVDMRRWRVELRCPECQWEDCGVFPQHVLDRYDAILDDGAAALIEDLNRLERANMEEQVNRFINALDGDEILPEDF